MSGAANFFLKRDTSRANPDLPFTTGALSEDIGSSEMTSSSFGSRCSPSEDRALFGRGDIDSSEMLGVEIEARTSMDRRISRNAGCRCAFTVLVANTLRNLDKDTIGNGNRDARRIDFRSGILVGMGPILVRKFHNKIHQTAPITVVKDQHGPVQNY